MNSQISAVVLAVAYIHLSFSVPTQEENGILLPGTCVGGEAVEKTGYKLGNSDILHECTVHKPSCPGCISENINCSSIVTTAGAVPSFFDCLCCPEIEEMSQCLLCKPAERINSSPVGK